MQYFSDYKVISILGNEHVRKFNTTFLVQHIYNGQKGVLKVFDKTNPKNSIYLGQIKHEASLNFDNSLIPKTLSVFEDSDTFAFIKEYYEGISLNTYLEKNKIRNKIDFTERFIKGFKDIFSELEKRKLIHCDIKPGNIIINEKKGGLTFRLIDYGLSHYANQKNNKPFVFSLVFSSPEIILNREDFINHTSDFFSLGIILWKILNDNETPLFHPNPAVMTNLQVCHPLPEVKNYGKEMNEFIQRITSKPALRTSVQHIEQEELTKTMKEALERRFQSFDEVINDFKKIKQNYDNNTASKGLYRISLNTLKYFCQLIKQHG